jgi:hypothetical protein
VGDRLCPSSSLISTKQKVIEMLTRSENQKIMKSKRKLKIKSLFLRLINFTFKTYLYLGLTYLTALAFVSIAYKSYLHQEPPFNYQQYIDNDTELAVVLTAVIVSFLFSGLIVIFTEQRKKPLQKKVEQKVEKKVRKRRSHKAA